MDQSAAWAFTSAGTLVVLVVLRDIFHTLWHPSGFGALARILFRGTWRVFQLPPLKNRFVELSGPVGLLAVVATWAALVVVGFALIYYPNIPDGFFFGSSLRPPSSSDVVASLYLSLVTVSTLGFGDIVPSEPFLRLVIPLEAFLGFVLLTAAISWALQLYPALGRRRALSRHLRVMYDTKFHESLSTDTSAVEAAVLEQVTSQLTSAESDLLQYGESYYFRESDSALALPAALLFASDLATCAKTSDSSAVRRAGGRLEASITSFGELLGSTYLADSEDVLMAFAKDHGQAKWDRGSA